VHERSTGRTGGREIIADLARMVAYVFFGRRDIALPIKHDGRLFSFKRNCVDAAGQRGRLGLVREHGVNRPFGDEARPERGDLRKL
jgi:hypothetical protein